MNTRAPSGVHFLAERLYTGQELEAETGLYNYGARIYDQQTGRFLQPDPVHSERIGYDNSDRYLYVHSNPVNFHDPDGRAPEAGYEFDAPSISFAARNGPPFDTHNLKAGDLLLLGLFSDLPPTMKLSLLLLAINFSNGTNFPAFPGYRYSGSGSTDPFDGLNSRTGRRKGQAIAVASYAFLYANLLLGVPLEASAETAIAATVLAFFLAEVLSPRPIAPGDALGVDHDRNVPAGGQFRFGPEETDRQHMKADGIFIRDGIKALARWITDPALWQQQYHRSYDSLAWVEQRGYGKTTRSILATGLTLINFVIDVVVIAVGIVLFATDFVLRFYLVGIRWYGQWLKRTFHVPGARYRNLTNPIKWRL